MKKQNGFVTLLPFWFGILPTVITSIVVARVYPTLLYSLVNIQEREPAGWTFVGFYNFERLFNLVVFGESVGPDDHFYLWVMCP